MIISLYLYVRLSVPLSVTLSLFLCLETLTVGAREGGGWRGMEGEGESGMGRVEEGAE